MVDLTRRNLLGGAAAAVAATLTKQSASAKTPEAPATVVTVVKFDGQGQVVTTPSNAPAIQSPKFGFGDAATLYLNKEAHRLIDAVPNGTPATAFAITQPNGSGGNSLSGFVIATGQNAEAAALKAFEVNFPNGGFNEFATGKYSAVRVNVPNSTNKPDVAASSVPGSEPARTEKPVAIRAATPTPLEPLQPAPIQRIIPAPLGAAKPN